MKHEWLETGRQLLTEDSFDFERDFLLPLPDAALKGAARGRALYSDSAAFSQKLLGSAGRAASCVTRAPVAAERLGGGPFLPPGAVGKC